jgi:hypothetical protein
VAQRQRQFLRPITCRRAAAIKIRARWRVLGSGLNCGDIIVAESGSYNSSNMQISQTVSCPDGNNVVWSRCAVFDTCKATGGGGPTILVAASYWGVQGWEAANTGSTGPCFAATSPKNAPALHHIVFANDVANGCEGNGITTYGRGGAGSVGVDYFVAIGNLVYNAAQGKSECFSGISLGMPSQLDSNTGTHIYLAWNILWHNIDGCPGHTDGEGIVLDTFWGSNYTVRTVVENNLAIGNGGQGFEINGTRSPIVCSPTSWRNNTAYGNLADPRFKGYQADAEFQFGPYALCVTATNNIGQGTAGAIGGHPPNGMFVGVGDASATSVIDNNALYQGVSKDHILDWSAAYNCVSPHRSPVGPFINQINSTPKPICAGMLLGRDPGFANPTIPTAPNCANFATTRDCMAPTLAAFVATNPGVAALGGEQTAAPTDANNTTPFLCNIYHTLPTGLVPNRC